MEKKKKQYEAVKAFGEALHGLRVASIKWVYAENGPRRTINLIDMKSGQHVGQYGSLDMTMGGLLDIEPQELEEFVTSSDYFGKIAEDV